MTVELISSSFWTCFRRLSPSLKYRASISSGIKVSVMSSGWMESGFDVNFSSNDSMGFCHEAINRIRFESAKHNCLVMIGLVSGVMCEMCEMMESRSEMWADSGSS